VGSSGESAVRNAGSTWEILGNLTLGGYDLAPGGAASLEVSDSGRVSVGEKFVLWPGSSVSVSNATVTIGEIDSDNTDMGLVLGAGGALMGEGSVAGNLVNDAGVIDLGRYATLFLVEGTFTQRSPATLIADIAGVSPGVDYDSLNVLGHASLAGTLVVRVSPEFAPELGDEFLVLTYASRDGDFDTISHEGNLEGFFFFMVLASFCVSV
jgi:T5SS/PEP-CTERM-associated repeat protein